MLAKSMVDMADKIKSDIDAGMEYYVQGKLNGVRMIADKNGLWSRNGNRFYAPEIWDACVSIFKDFPDLILDGEWFSFENRWNLSQTLSQIRVNPEGLQFHVFDTIEDKPFSSRLKTLFNLKELGAIGGCDESPIKLVNTYKLKNFDQMMDEIASALVDGMEGLMVRRSSGIYQQGKRSVNLVKCKLWHEGEFFIDTIGVNDDGLPVNATLWTRDRETFFANIEGSHNYWLDVVKNRTESAVGTVRFLTTDSDGLPVNPVLTCVRNYE